MQAPSGEPPLDRVRHDALTRRTVLAGHLVAFLAAATLLLAAAPGSTAPRPATSLATPAGAARLPTAIDLPAAAPAAGRVRMPSSSPSSGGQQRPAVVGARAVVVRPPQAVPVVTAAAELRPTPTPVPVPVVTAVPFPVPAEAVPGAGAPGATPGSAASRGGSGARPPVCDYLDVLTRHHGLGDWAIALLDTIYRLPADHAPGDLVDSSAAGLSPGYPVRQLVVADLAAMASAAREAGAPIAVVSGYRSHATQEATFQRWVNVSGYDDALRTSARPGHSEHQLGTALDLTSEGGVAPWDYADWGATPAGAWVARNSWRYGFVVSYPPGSFERTCYSYEPWHVRYVGRERAAAIMSSGLTPREFLWRIQ